MGSFIRFDTKGLEFVMTAMFVVIFLEQWLKEKKHYTELIGVGASVLCLVIFGAESFLIPTLLCILCFLALFRKPIEKAGGKSWVAGTAGYYACDFASFMEAEYVAFHRRRYRLLYATGSIYVLIGSFVPLFQETTENGQLFMEKCRKT